ncbi:MAG: hypothetical protein H6638_07235 [Ardenticatenales bacterium]|nr:hypothetical protein [Ardenticatenales bacterium]
MSANDWWKRAVFIRFTRAASPTVTAMASELRGIIEKLDYLQWLGIDAIWLSPTSRRRRPIVAMMSPIIAMSRPNMARWTTFASCWRVPMHGDEGGARSGDEPQLGGTSVVPSQSPPRSAL